MRQVTKNQFYSSVGQHNVHPYIISPKYPYTTEWRNPSGRVYGKIIPENGVYPAGTYPFHTDHYFLSDDIKIVESQVVQIIQPLSTDLFKLGEKPMSAKKTYLQETCTHDNIKTWYGGGHQKGQCLDCYDHGLAQRLQKEHKERSSTSIEYSIHNARYSKGNLLVRCPSPDGYKTRASRLVGDGLKGRWTNREGGYIVSPTKAKKFERLYTEGWDASTVTGELYHREISPLV